VNQEESEHNEVDGMKKGADSTGEVMVVLNGSYTKSSKGGSLICELLMLLLSSIDEIED